jgi:hypothetical protein
MTTDLSHANSKQHPRPNDIRSINDLSGRAKRIHELIARRAYAIYKGRGHVDGHAKEDWRQAQSEVLAFLGSGLAWRLIISGKRDVPDACECQDARRATVRRKAVRGYRLKTLC